MFNLDNWLFVRKKSYPRPFFLSPALSKGKGDEMGKFLSPALSKGKGDEMLDEMGRC